MTVFETFPNQRRQHEKVEERETAISARQKKELYEQIEKNLEKTESKSDS